MLLKRQESGKPTPAMEQLPNLSDDLVFFWEMFVKLHGRRGENSLIVPAAGGGLRVIITPNPLRVVDVKAMLDIHGARGEYAIEAMDLIFSMDEKYLEFESKTRERGSRENASEGKK